MIRFKIKDNVDLKELEKYGFEEGHSEKYIGTDDDGRELYAPYTYYRIEIHYEDKWCGAKTSASWYVRDYDRFIGSGSCSCKFQEELQEEFLKVALFDMINDGLVEKVSVKQ